MSGFRLRGLCGTSRASAGRLRPIGLAALATCIILLSSFGSALAQTTFTSITPSSSTVAVGTPITLTANVTPPIGPTGTVGFYYEPQNFLGTANLNSSGVAVLSNVLLPVGLHLVYAIYNGDANFASSTSTPVLVNVTGPPTIAKGFSPASIVPNGLSTLTITITNPAAAAQDGVAFTDNLPANVVVAIPNGLTSTCGGTATATAGSGSISLTGGSVADSGSCAISVNVTSSIPGTYNNTTGPVSSTFGTGSTSNTATLTVGTAPTTLTLTSSLNPSQVGQSVTFTAKVTGLSPTGTVTFKDGATVLGTGTLNANGLATFTTSSLPSGNHAITAVYGGDANNTRSTSPVLTQVVNIPADSIRLRALQVAVTNIEAQSSGAAFSGAVDDAIADGFSEGGCTLISPRGNGVRINFGDDCTNPRHNTGVASQYDAVTASRMLAFGDNAPSYIGQSAGLPPSLRSFAPDQSMPSNRVDDSFTALGYAGPAVTKAPPLVPVASKEWQLWAAVRGTGWSTDQSVGDIHGGQINAITGLTRKLTPDFLVGVLGGYENFSYDSSLLDGRLKGDGWTVGAYLGWRLLPGLRFDASVGRSGINYNGVAGTAAGTFLGSRWLATTALIGTYETLYGIEIEPSAKVYALWEHENSYTDSLGTFQPDRNFASGRASTGVKATYPWLWAAMKVTPYAGVYADYYFNRDDNVPLSTSTDQLLLPTQFVHGWSARVTSGVDMMVLGGTRLSVGGEVGGLGNNFTVWSTQIRAAVPF